MNSLLKVKQILLAEIDTPDYDTLRKANVNSSRYRLIDLALLRLCF